MPGARVAVEGHAQLRAVRAGRVRRDHAAPLRPPRGKQRAQVTRHGAALRVQRVHAGTVEDAQAREERRERQDRRVRALPPVRARARDELRPHREARARVVSPPAREARDRRVGAVPLVHERARDRARPGVEVLVGAPAREVDAPVVEPRREVPRPVREVPAGERANGVRGRGDPVDRERLARRVVDAAEHDERQRVARLADRGQHVLLADQRLARARAHLDHVRVRVKPAGRDVRAHGVGVARERAALHEDLRAAPLGAPEAHHQEVQVHRQRVHHHHLARPRADEPRAQLPELLVVVDPRAPRVQVALDREARPVVELLLHDRARGPRQQAERVAAEVGERPPVRPRGELELVPERAERVRRVHARGELGRGVEGAVGGGGHGRRGRKM